MTLLGDYLGQLVSELALARMQADVESVRIAEMYASHSLLRHMAVPHFRLPEIELDIPIAISQVEASLPGKPPRGTIPRGRARDAVLDLVRRKARDNGFQMSFDKVERVLERWVADDRGAAIPLDITAVADDVAYEARSAVYEPNNAPLTPEEQERVARFSRELRHEVAVTLLVMRDPPPRVKVLATANELREHGGPDQIVRIRVKVREQAVEWSSVDGPDGERRRLIPE